MIRLERRQPGFPEPPSPHPAEKKMANEMRALTTRCLSISQLFPELISFHFGSSANSLSKSDAPNRRWASSIHHTPLEIRQEFPADRRFQRPHAHARAAAAELKEAMTFVGCPSHARVNIPPNPLISRFARVHLTHTDTPLSARFLCTESTAPPASGTFDSGIIHVCRNASTPTILSNISR